MDEAYKLLKNNVPRLAKANGNHFCVVRVRDRIYAFESLCPHLKEPLSNGKINHLDEIICPLHHFRFSLKTGSETSNRCRPLIIYPVAQETEARVTLVGRT
jgi:nitrite reductase/ring-hydroxylating ferredoxin subunit